MSRSLLLTGGSLLVGAVGRTDLLGAEPRACRTPTRCIARCTRCLLATRTSWPSTRRTARARCARPASPRPHRPRSATSAGTTRSSTRRSTSPLRTPAPLRPAGGPALLRPDAADQPGRPPSARRHRPAHPAAPVDGVERRDRPRARSSSMPGRPARTSPATCPGSLSIPAGTSFGTWLGWVVEPDRPVVLVVDGPRPARRPGAPGPAASAARRSAGYLQGGFARWVG